MTSIWFLFHGIYGRAGEVFEDGSFLVELVHHQQKGVLLLKAGERFGTAGYDAAFCVSDGSEGGAVE